MIEPPRLIHQGSISAARVDTCLFEERQGGYDLGREYGIRGPLVMVRTAQGHRDDIRGLALSPDGRELLTGGADGTTRVWDVESRRLLATLEHSDLVWGVAYSPDGKLFAAGDYSGEVRVYNRSTWTVHRIFKVSKSVQPIVFFRNGRTLITGSMDHTIRQWVVGNEPPWEPPEMDAVDRSRPP